MDFNFNNNVPGNFPNGALQTQTGNVPAQSQFIGQGFQFDALDESIIQRDAVQIMSIGDTIDPIPIEKFVMNTQKKERISVITNSELGIKYHYSPVIGTFFCFGSSCCENLGRPKVRYLLPIVVYETDSTGLKIISSSFSIKVLSLAPTAYEKIQTLSKLSSGDLTNVDILVTCMDDKFQEMDFHRIDGVAIWKSHEDMYKSIESQFRSVQKYIPLVVARKVSEETFKAKLEAGAGASQSNNGVPSDGRSSSNFSPSDFDNSFVGKK